MAAIVYTNINALLNPTTNYLPIKGSNQFEDSMLVQNNPNILTSVNINTGDDNGIYINNNTGYYIFGDYGGVINSQNILLDPTGRVVVNANKGIQLNMVDANPTLGLTGNITSATAGGSSGLHLALKINGIAYKIQLLNP